MSVFQYGLMGSALAAGLALFGAITFGYAWYPDVVRAQLETFLAEGKELLRIAQLEQEPVPLPAARHGTGGSWTIWLRPWANRLCVASLTARACRSA